MQAMTTKIAISTRRYVATWGREPKGRGFWLFGMEAADGRCGQFSHSSGYAEALKQAKAYAKANGCDTIELLP